MIARRPEFPGMDPWLEHPELWPGVHNRLVVAIADALAERLDPRYFVDVETRTAMVGREEPPRRARPDVTVEPSDLGALATWPAAAVADLPGVEVAERDLPEFEVVEEWFLEVRTVAPRAPVTAIEVLSPTNKALGPGRGEYLAKRARVIASQTNLVEIDLLRAGPPMPMRDPPEPADYRVLVSRGHARPRATVYRVGVRWPLPVVPIPLLPDDPDVGLALNGVLHGLFARARYYRLPDYDAPPVPPLRPEDAAWAAAIVEAAKGTPEDRR